MKTNETDILESVKRISNNQINASLGSAGKIIFLTPNKAELKKAKLTPNILGGYELEKICRTLNLSLYSVQYSRRGGLCILVGFNK